jgi:alpha-L-rhamnosidase
LEGAVVNTDMKRIGDFTCSHPLLNRLHLNVVYSTKSNVISLPTDCPQRDERLGWTGDIQVFGPTLAFLFDACGFLGNWLHDVRSSQAENNGIVPLIVPHLKTILDLSIPQAVWGDVAALLPWDLFNASGDRELLVSQFESMTSWLDRGVRRDASTGLWDNDLFQLADWLDPRADPESPADGVTDPWLVANAYLIHTTRTVAKVSHILGRDDHAERYARQADEMQRIFLELYVTPLNRVVSDSQTALSLLLHFDLLNDKVPNQRQTVAQRLGNLVTKQDWLVATGFVGTPIILHTLAENDMLHHAYRMLQARDCPSWLSPILLGATTVWERWDSMLADGSINPGGMTSFNHYALGSVALFLHSVVGGLSPLSPGWKRILVKPQPGGSVVSACTGFTSPYGRIECEWEIKEDRLNVRVVVPPNTTAVVELPGLREEIRSGSREYCVEWSADPRFLPKPKELSEFEPHPHVDWIP